ncbi:hypothetical protein JOD54_003264 [Actinokineospora baliensis]|nr:hypothetical protein [Actinokineospora baliensis]MBM7773060.1 hypothetical protein [Actinokineospora baliensis]
MTGTQLTRWRCGSVLSEVLRIASTTMACLGRPDIGFLHQLSSSTRR